MSSVARSGPSEWRRGGACLGSAVVGYAAGFGFFVFSANLFIEPMRAEFGWTSSEATFLPISLLVLGGLFPVAGRMSDRFGPRPLAMAGLAGFAACFVLLATLPLTVGIVRTIAIMLGACCAAAGAVPFGRATVSWFRQNAGLALGLAGSGSTLGGVLGVPFCALFIERYGWRSAYIAMASVVLIVGLPAVYRFLRLNEKDLPGASRNDGPEEAGGASARSVRLPALDPRFWLLLAAMTCSGVSIGVYLNHLRPILAERSFSLGSAAFLGSAFSMATFVGRIVAGFLLDRAIPLMVAAVCLFCGALGAALIMMVPVPSVLLMAAALILIGMAYGAEADFAAFFALRFFGLARFSISFGALAMMIAFAIALGGFVAAKTVDIYGDYRLAVALAPLGFGIAAILMLCLAAVAKQRKAL